MNEAKTPGQAASIPLADLTDREVLNAVGGAAQAYDYENRPRDHNWTPVPLDQVGRLITGALGAMEFEQLAPGGVALIAAERTRQIEQEGYTAAHDQCHVPGDLAGAAACYAIASRGYELPDAVEAYWPPSWRFSGGDPVRMLVKAGALIAAEIDRLQGEALAGQQAVPEAITETGAQL